MPPWEKYGGQQSAGPWAKYGGSGERAAASATKFVDIVTGKNLPKPLARFNQDALARVRGATGGFLDEAAGKVSEFATNATNALADVVGREGTGYTGKEAYRATREALNNYGAKQRRERPVTTVVNEVAGGSWLPAMKTNSLLKAGAYGAGVGAVTGAGEGDGLADRAKKAAIGGAVGFGVGATGQRAANALANVAQRAKTAAPSAARQLAQEGVQLTPGQMMGGMARRMEDAATSVPIVGDAIRNRRIEGIEGFNRVAINRVLKPLGEELPADVNVGRDGVLAAQEAVSRAYTRALEPVQVAADPEFVLNAGRIRTASRLTPELAREYESLLDNTIAPALGKTITGQEWKTVDADIGAAMRAADNAAGQQPSAVYLKRALESLRNEWKGLLVRTSPEAAQAVSAADQANANLVRVRGAAQGNGAVGGVFTPAQLSNAVRGADSSAGNRNFATGNALMQDLTDRGREVLPSTVPESGTALRSLMTALGVGGGGVALGIDPTVATTAAATLGSGAAFYSRPVQNLINAAYRASSPGAKRAAVAQLQQLGARNPGLQAEIDRAISEIVAGQADRRQSQAQPSR